MLRHQLTTAWRNLVRQKDYTLIHILGLSLGICTSVIIFLITRHELSYVRFHPAGNRIYRLVAIQKDELNNQDGIGFMIRPLPLALRQELTGFDKVTEFHHYYGRVTIGLATFSADQRTKEIAIRKTLGADGNDRLPNDKSRHG